MAARKMDESLMEETVRRVEVALEDGHAPPWAGGGGAVSEAARRAIADGFADSINGFKSRFYTAQARHRDADWSKYRAPVYQRPVGKVELDSYKIAEANKPSGRRVKVCVIGDAHDDPRMEDKARFTWLGKWANDQEPDQIVQIGDWATFDSMSAHGKEGSNEVILRPSWPQDLESLAESINAFERGLGTCKIKKMLTEGNHETRVSRYENLNPSIGNALTVQWRSLFRDSGWNIRDFGEYYFIEGVGFIHHMINAVGRAFGGKTGNQRAGNDLTFSVVHGHDHKRELVSSPKIGPFQPVSVMSVGCALPHGWVEPYAQHSVTGWWWGATTLWVQDGAITDVEFTSMLALEERYGKTTRKSAVTPQNPAAPSRKGSPTARRSRKG